MREKFTNGDTRRRVAVWKSELWVEVTALHNHFFWDDPHVYFMHVHGMGTAAELARRTKPGIKFDAGLKRTCYSGAISVFKMDDPDHYRKLEDFPVQKKVHSLAVDQETHRVYAPEQEADGKAVARMVVYDPVANQ